MLKQTLLIALLLIFVLGVVIVQAQDNGESQVVEGEFDSETLSRVYQYRLYLPVGYDTSEQSYPVVYLLHGRGDTMTGWLNIRSTLDEMIAQGEIPPMIAVMPDMPSSDRGSYYVDSAYTGNLYRGEAVETAFFSDLIPHIDATYRTIADRGARIIGGYSMGGYGAIRYVLAHSDQFMGAIILSPAVYTPLPPVDSSAREFGAFGVETSLFDEDIYTNLNYPTLLENFDGENRLNLFIAVGDDEWRHPNPEDIEHDLDFEAHRFYNRVSRISGIASEFRVYNGGHDWDVWIPGFVEGITYLANYLDTTTTNDETSNPDGWLTGTSGDDFAGGVGVDMEGNIYQALAVAGSLGDQTHVGGLDMAVVKYGTDRSIQWTRQLGTSGDDRPYGLVVTAQQEVVIVGYMQGDGDDIAVVKFSADGELLWQTQFGTVEADRGYAIALAENDAVVISGYTRGDLAGTNAGDKDIVTAMLDANGEILWIHQTGGEGEDKGQAVAFGEDGMVYSAGMTTSELETLHGGIDAFVLELTAQGEQTNLLQLGTVEWDEITGIVVNTDNQLILTGFTAGDLISTLNGDKDIFMMVLDSDWQPVAGEQIGSNLNDKGAALTFMDDGSVVLTGYSDGAITDNVGGFDVIVVRYNASFERTRLWQFGTVERDGTDEWAERNLFMSSHENSVILSGLTLGEFGESTLSGGSDVFITTISDWNGE